MGSDRYNQYLQSLHDKKQTPDEVIADVVREGTGRGVVAKRKIVAGEVNEVYDIELDDRRSVILRVSPNGQPDFLHEQWAIEECNKIGIPVPAILFVKYQTIDDKEYGFCLMEKIEGDTLERGSIDFDDFNTSQKKDYIHQAGEILAKIHSIHTNGWGWIVKDKGQFESADKLLMDWDAKKEEFERLASGVKIKDSVMQKAFEQIAKLKEKYQDKRPCLNHADFGNKHLVVRQGKIVAVLDWGSVRSDLPIYDFANWDFWFGEDIPTEWLKEGYSNRAIFDGEFEELLHMLRIQKGMENLSWYQNQKYDEMMELVKSKLESDVRYFM